MKIKVFIPTFRRVNSLQAVLYSLIKVNLPVGNFKFECYVVNNFPDHKDIIDEITVSFLKGKTNVWDIIAIHREKTIPPITNWYSAIQKYTNDDEIAFLHGDDDLFLPDSIIFRVNSILNENAELLLTTHTGGVFFYDNTNDISINRLQTIVKGQSIRQIGFCDNKWSAIFIGNNTYHMTPILRKAFEKAMEWCEEQDWLTYNQRTLMYPIYIPIALIYLGGKVISSEKECVIRCMNIDECRRAFWGVPGWNSGFLHLSYLGVLNNYDLKLIKELDLDRKAANNFAAQWYWTFFLDPRISKKVRRITFQKIGKPIFIAKTLKDSLVFIIKGILSKFKLFNQLKEMIKPQKIMSNPKAFIDSLYTNAE